jgi:AcrR family transcriptional regulator
MPKKRDKKAAILDAMLDLVVERGFHNAPMSLLAKRSGASPGIIYHYFPSKDGIIHALYQRIASRKREAFLTGIRENMSPREAALRMWLNSYHFYRAHRRETRFLDQYLNSPYCQPDASHKQDQKDPTMARFLKLWRPKSKGGVLKDLPPEAINSLSLGLAATLAKSPRKFPPKTLKKIAETVWTAVADE